MADLNELQQSVEWLGARLTKVEDRVDRLYAQARIFTINSQALEDKWLGMGEQAGPGQMAAQGGGEAWLEEVTKALGVVWPLPREEPNRPRFSRWYFGLETGKGKNPQGKGKGKGKGKKGKGGRGRGRGSKTLWYGGVAGRYLGSWRVFKHQRCQKQKKGCQGNTTKKKPQKHTRTVFEILNPPRVEVRRSGHESASTNIASPEMFYATIVPAQKGENLCAVTSCSPPRHF